ncbi:ANTAR domain-containing protein [Arthrobacter sp. CP30]
MRLADLSDRGADLRAAMEGRHVIDTAGGIIMSQTLCSQEEAFVTLRQASSSRNTKLLVLAQSILDNIGTTPTP